MSISLPNSKAASLDTSDQSKQSKGSRLALRVLLGLLKLVLLCFLIGMISKNMSSVDLTDLISARFILLVPLLVILSQLAYFLMSLRLWFVLKMFDINLKVLHAFRINLESFFYFVCIPVAISFETSKFCKILKLVKGGAPKIKVMGGLVFDRVVGIGVLCCTSLFCIFIAETKITFSIPWLVLAFLIAGGFIALASGWWWFGKETSIGLLKMLLATARKKVGLLLASTVTSFLMCFANVTLVFFIVRELNVDLSYFQVFFVISLSILAQMFPVSLAGAGPGEITGIYLYNSLGVASEKAVAIVAVFYFFKLFAALVGGISEATKSLPLNSILQKYLNKLSGGQL